MSNSTIKKRTLKRTMRGKPMNSYIGNVHAYTCIYIVQHNVIHGVFSWGFFLRTCLPHI